MKNKEAIKIFTVEDDPIFARLLEYVLSLDPEHEVRLFNRGGDLIDHLHLNPSIITVDYTLPDISGELLIYRIRNLNPHVPIIIVSGQEDIKTAVKLLKEGAYDYITKDEDLRERLLHSINKAKKNISLTHEVEMLREQLSGKYDFGNTLIGQSDAMRHVFSMMEKAVKTNISVSITGETGTGKELVAKAIHYNSPRKKEPFVPVNIAAIPDSLLESELFGHEKGAFTGATARRIGKFEEANKGTIFLDEIGEMDVNLQAKLLRVLQERELVRVGGSQTVKLDVRIITATHRDLAEEVKSGRFREDLYYRLLGLPVYLPPLRERDKDVLLMAKKFAQDFALENQMGEVSFSAGVQASLLKYHFPGNVRELKALIELAVVMSANGKITEDSLHFNALSTDEYLFLEEKTLKDYIFLIVKTFMKKYNNNVLKVAAKLDIGKSTIYRYLKEIDKEKVGAQ